MKETDFARYLTQFLSTYLPGQVGSKRNTQLAYRDSFSLFLRCSIGNQCNTWNSNYQGIRRSRNWI